MITPLSLSSGSAFWTANPAQALLQCLLGFIEYPAQSRFDMATHGATFFDRVLMDRECFWCLDRPIEKMYVDSLQFTTVLLPLLSTGCYPDDNFPGQCHGKWRKTRTLKAGSSPRRAQEETRRATVCHTFDRLMDF
jgi:hypothetical protein